MNDSQTIYERIKQLREMQGISQAELARKCGYSNRSTIAKIEKGERNLTANKIQTIANALGVSPLLLIDDKQLNIKAYTNEKITKADSELLELLKKIPKKKKEEIIEYLKFLVNKDENK